MSQCPRCGSEDIRVVETACLDTEFGIPNGEVLAFNVCGSCDYGINEHTEGVCSCEKETSKMNNGELIVPRVARSIEDLRVGQVVAIHEDGEWTTHTVSEVEPPQTFGDKGTSGHFWTRDGAGGSDDFLRRYTVVILSDPPAPPYVVPREAVERLREAVAVSGPHTFAGELYLAARALLDAAEEQA